MKWTKIILNVKKGGADSVCAELSVMGHDMVEIIDPDDFLNYIRRDKPIWEIADVNEVDRGKRTVSFYLPEGDPAIAEFSIDNPNVLSVDYETSDEDEWLFGWKKYYKPLKIGERILIQPEWEPLDGAEGRVVFRCEPGVSFGTGEHATTRMCLEFLDKYVEGGEKVSDLGCGSGILGVTALLLGAEKTIAADVDPLAVKIASGNAERNGVEMTVFQADLMKDGNAWAAFAESGIVCANLVADLLIMFAPKLYEITRPGGKLIASGIIAERAGEVRAALERAGFAIGETAVSGGWEAEVALK